MRISRAVSLLRRFALCGLLCSCPAFVLGQTPPCVAFPAGVAPFSRIDYISLPNSSGDRLVVGSLASQSLLSAIPLPSATNQRYCGPVELMPGLAAIAYVPSPAERSGDFSPFAGILVDPLTHSFDPLRGSPFPGGRIPASRLFPCVADAAGAVGTTCSTP
jgi:hypothetical protein